MVVNMPKAPHHLHRDRSVSKISSLLPFGISFGSGILMGLAPAPLNLFPLAWVALAPLWVLVLGCRQGDQGTSNRADRRAIALALAWGLGYHGLALSWITGLHPLTWLGLPWLASVAIVLFCWGFISLWGAALVAVWVWLILHLAPIGDRLQRTENREHKTGDKALLHNPDSPSAANPPLPSPASPSSPALLSFPSSLRRVLIGTALWCALEWLWSLGPLDWTALAYTQSPSNLALLHLGQLSGPVTVTSAIVAMNGLLAEAWFAVQSNQFKGNQLNRRLVLPFALCIGVHLLGYMLYVQPLAATNLTTLNVGIIQGNVPPRIKLGSEGIRRAMEGYTNGYEVLAAQGVDAVLTPEGALPFLWNEPNKVRSSLYQAVLQRGVVLWLGTFTAYKDGIARSLLTIAGNGETISHYDKIKLVPLGEYIPFQKLLGNVISILSPIAENGLPGKLNQRFETPFGRTIASICYDSAFSDVFRSQAAAGGQFILTASNLDPYSEVLMAQHQAQDVMRAVETDRWAVRATNTGYSGVIDPHGQIIWRSQPRIYQTHSATIFRRQTQTLYVRWGDWLTPLLVGLSAIAPLVSWRRYQ